MSVSALKFDKPWDLFRRSTVLLAGSSTLQSSLFLVVASGVGAALNLTFSLVFLRMVGANQYSMAAPLLTTGAVAATAAIGVQYLVAAFAARSRSLIPAVRQMIAILVLGTPLLILAPVIASFLHIDSNVPVLLATLLFVCTFAASIPIGMLLGRGCFRTLGVISILIPTVRVLSFIPFIHHEPIDAALVISILVTVLGAFAMAVIASNSDSWQPVPISSELKLRKIQWIGRSAIGLGLFLPFVIPTWLARADLQPGQAANVALAALLSAGALMLAGPVISVVVPKVALGVGRGLLNSAALLSVALAMTSAFGIWLIGPFATVHLFHHSSQGLGGPLTMLIIAVPGWALISYWIWIGVTEGRRISRYLVALFIGESAQVITSSLVHSTMGVSAGPLVALVVSGAFLVLTSSPAVVSQVKSPTS